MPVGARNHHPPRGPIPGASVQEPQIAEHVARTAMLASIAESLSFIPLPGDESSSTMMSSRLNAFGSLSHFLGV